MYLQHANLHHRQSSGQFLEENLPIKILAHLTFPHRVSREVADEHFHNWTHSIERVHRAQIGYIVAYEKTKNIPLHLHAALVAPVPLDVSVAEYAWRGQVGISHKTCFEGDRYEPGKGGIAYLLKAENEDQCDVRLSDNLPLFQLNPPKEFVAGLGCRDRRRFQHIQAAMENQLNNG